MNHSRHAPHSTHGSTLYAAVAFAFCLFASGCALMDVRDRFEASASCPADRVTVTQLSGRPAWMAPRPPPAPPPDIAADAERAAIFRLNHPPTDSYPTGRVFAANGCGQREYYICDFPPFDDQRTCDRAREPSGR